MKLYLYRMGDAVPMLELDAISYTDYQVVTVDGTIYSPLAEDCELSATADCTGTLREDWRRKNPSTEMRLEELESLVAEVLFGGDAK